MASVPGAVQTWLRLILPEGCLLCCPALLMSWRAGAGCCCVHWRLPSAAFPAHRSFVCQREREEEGIKVVKKGRRATIHSVNESTDRLKSFFFLNQPIPRVSPEQIGLLTRGMSLAFSFIFHVIHPAVERKKNKNSIMKRFVQFCSSSIRKEIQIREVSHAILHQDWSEMKYASVPPHFPSRQCEEVRAKRAGQCRAGRTRLDDEHTQKQMDVKLFQSTGT